MKYSITTPPASQIIDWPFLRYHCRITANDDEPGTGEITERSYVETLRDAAVNYAEERMACSLLEQEITAIFYTDDACYPPIIDPRAAAMTPLVVFGNRVRTLALILPRGPVVSVSSVTDGNNNPITDFSLEQIGNTDHLRLSAPIVVYPITVVYTAGLASIPADVPPMIRQAIATHVGTLYENRESITDAPVNLILHGLEAFYRLRSRNSGIG